MLFVRREASAKQCINTTKTKNPSRLTRRAVFLTHPPAARAANNSQAMFPVAPTKSELPHGYGEVLSELKKRIQQTRLKTVIASRFSFIGSSVKPSSLDKRTKVGVQKSSTASRMTCAKHFLTWRAFLPETSF